MRMWQAVGALAGRGWGDTPLGSSSCGCPLTLHVSQCKDAIHAILFVLGVEPGTLLGLFAGRLRRRACFELASDAMEIIRHLRVRFQEEKLEVSGFILELNLGAVGQDLAYAATGSKQGQNLRPMRALNHVQAQHQRLLLFSAPWSARGVRSFPSRMC